MFSTSGLAIPSVLSMNFPKTFSHSSQFLLERALGSSTRNHFQVLLSSSSQNLPMFIDSLSSSVSPIPLCLLLCFFSVPFGLIDKHCFGCHCINARIQCNYIVSLQWYYEVSMQWYYEVGPLRGDEVTVSQILLWKRFHTQVSPPFVPSVLPGEIRACTLFQEYSKQQVPSWKQMEWTFSGWQTFWVLVLNLPASRA